MMEQARSALSADLPAPGTAPPDNTLQVLERLCHAVNVDFDYTLAKQVYRTAQRELPGLTFEETLARLALTGTRLGLLVRQLRTTLHEALDLIRSDAPLLVFATNHPEGPRWLLLTRQRRKKALIIGLEKEAVQEVWVSERELAKFLGLKNPHQPFDWLCPQASMPCGAMETPGTTHGHPDLNTVHPHGPGGEEHHGHSHLSPFRRLMGLLKPEWPDIKVVTLFALGIGVLMLAVPIAVETLVNTIAIGGLRQPLLVVSLLLAAALSFAALLRGLQIMVMETVQRRIFVRVVADLSYRLPRVKLEAYDREHGPELVNRFFDVMTVQKVSASLLLEGISVVLQATIGLAVLAFYHPFLLWFDMVLIAAIAFIIVNLGRGAVATAIQESIAKYEVAGWLEEVARSPRSFKFASSAEYALDRADTLARYYLRAREGHFTILFRQIIFALGLQVIASTALLGFGGWLVIEGQMTLGQLVAAELIVTVIVGSLTKLGKQMENWYDLMAAVDKVGHLIDLPLERLSGEAIPPLAGPASLKMQNVRYGYGPKEPVLKDLSLSIAAGERVALVGPNGSGKSTFCDLILGFREPQHGMVALDDYDLRDVRLEWLREQVALVSRLEIIEGTVLENIRLGRENIGLRAIREALQAVGLLDDVLGLPQGLNTMLSPAGSPLSSGQAERLRLVTAVVGKPRLLVLDETLDNLDTFDPGPVCDLVFDPAAPWTLVVVTSNPVFIRRCQRKIVLQGGQQQHDRATLAALDEAIAVTPGNFQWRQKHGAADQPSGN